MPDAGPLDEAAAIGPRALVTHLHPATSTPLFSLCVLVTNWSQFDDCLASYRRGGFDEAHCEVLVIDNARANKADAYVGLNEFLQAAAGRYVILSHQDVLLLDDGRIDLEDRFEELTRIDPHWGVCGNAGYSATNEPVLFLSHPVSDDHVRGGPFPARVVSLDENFMVVRKEANLALSRDLRGFHHYGADLCTIADVLGWTAYVVAFKLRHLSPGTVDRSYAESADRFGRKYARALRSRWINLVTEKPVYVSGSRAATYRARAVRVLGDRVRHARAIAGTMRARLRDG